MWETVAALTNVNRVNVGKDERLISFIVGSMLLLYALIRIPFTAVISLIIALYLFFRSIRGFCYIYDQLGQNTAVPSPKLERSENEENALVHVSIAAEPA